MQKSILNFSHAVCCETDRLTVLKATRQNEWPGPACNPVCDASSRLQLRKISKQATNAELESVAKLCYS